MSRKKWKDNSHSAEAKHIDSEGMFLSGEALLKSEAHINTGSLACHFAGGMEPNNVAFYISSHSIRASICGSETDFFSYQLSAILFIPLI